MFQESSTELAFLLWSYLGQPDSSFDRFDLTKERSNVAEFVVSPVLKEAGSDRGYLPVVWIGDFPPCVDLPPHGVDDLGMLVFLFVSGYFRRFTQAKFRLLGSGAFLLLGFGDRRDELGGLLRLTIF